MSKFNPTSWLNRSRVFSDSSNDMSISESLAGLKFASQSQSSLTGGAMTSNEGLSPVPPPPSPHVERLTSSVYSSTKKSKSKLLRQRTQDEKVTHSPNVRHHARHQSEPVVSAVHYPLDSEGYGLYHNTNCPSVELGAIGALRDPNDHVDGDSGMISYSHSRSHSNGASTHNSQSVSVDNINTNPTMRQPSVASRSRNASHAIKRNESYENSSVISGLSADETHCGDDGKSYKSNKSASELSASRGLVYQSHQSHHNHPLTKGHVRHGTEGRDFGDAFDHLIHAPTEHHHYRNSPSQNHRKRYSSKPAHHRSQSDTTALRHPPSSSSTNYHLTKKLPAHATLREQLTSANKSSSIPRPQILQSRSTSNTVQSLSSTSSSIAPDAFRNCTTQPVTHGVTTSSSGITTTTTTNGLRTVPSSGSGFSHPSIEQSGDETTSSHSLNSYRKHNELLGTRPRRKFNPSSGGGSASSNPTSTNYNTSTTRNPHCHPSSNEDCDERSLQDVPEGDPSTNWNDGRSLDGRSVLSSANGSARSTGTPRSRKKVKDELKFILKKLIPGKLLVRNIDNITLERSEGCLT